MEFTFFQRKMAKWQMENKKEKRIVSANLHTHSWTSNLNA